MGNSFFSILLLSSLKSDIKWTLPFFLGIINVGAAHCELCLLFIKPMFTNLFSSVVRVSSCTFGIENDLARYSWAPSWSLI